MLCQSLNADVGREVLEHPGPGCCSAGLRRFSHRVLDELRLSTIPPGLNDARASDTVCDCGSVVSSDKFKARVDARGDASRSENAAIIREESGRIHVKRWK